MQFTCPHGAAVFTLAMLVAVASASAHSGAPTPSGTSPHPLKHYRTPGLPDPDLVSLRPHHRPHARRLLATARTKLAATRTSAGQGAHVVSPIDFGADPSGATDSSDAFDKAVQAM